MGHELYGDMKVLMTTIQALTWLALIMLPVTVAFKMAHQISWRRAYVYSLGLIVAALIVSIDDIAWPMGPDYCDDRDDPYACECTEEYLEYVDIYRDSQGSLVYVKIRDFVIDNPTDGVLVMMGICIDRAIWLEKRAGSKEAFVLVVNEGPAPVARRLIDQEFAARLADRDVADAEYSAYDPDLEEMAYMDGYRYDDWDD